MCGSTLDYFKNCCVKFCEQPDMTVGYSCGSREAPLEDPECPKTFRRTQQRADKDCTVLGTPLDGCSVKSDTRVNVGGKTIAGFSCAGPGIPEEMTCEDHSFCPGSRVLMTPTGDKFAVDNLEFYFKVDASGGIVFVIEYIDTEGYNPTSASLTLKLGDSAVQDLSCTATGSIIECDALPKVLKVSTPCCLTDVLFTYDVVDSGNRHTGTAVADNFNSLCVACTEDGIAAGTCAACIAIM